jgi:hypothetical protein
LKSALQLGDLINPGDRESLLTQLEGMRTNVLRKIEELSSKQARPALFYYVDRKINLNQHIGDIVDDHSYNFGDVSDSEIKGVFGSGNTVEESFNEIDQSGAGPELKEVLKELVQAVGQLDERVPQADREAAARDLDGLIKEATADSPRRGRIEMLGDGLIQTAEKIGKAALPIAKLAAQLIALFG